MAMCACNSLTRLLKVSSSCLSGEKRLFKCLTNCVADLCKNPLWSKRTREKTIERTGEVEEDEPEHSLCENKVGKMISCIHQDPFYNFCNCMFF